MTSFSDWSAILEPKERVLWEGSPVAGLHKPFNILAGALFGLPFLAGGVIAAYYALWAITGSAEWQMVGLGFLFLVFSVPFLGVGLWLVAGVSVDRLTAPRRLRYVLTDRRALILSRFPRQKTDSYPIHKSSPLVHERSRRVGSVYFHVQAFPDADGGMDIKRTGFENIAESEQVFRLMRQVQQAGADQRRP